MRRFSGFLLCCAFVVSGCSSGRPPAADIYDSQRLGEFLKDTAGPLDNEYYIGVGDVLDVVFFFHQDLTTVGLRVRSDGRITLPYVGDVMASGQTPMQLDSTLTGHFAEILRDPNLSVIIRKTAEMRVYVLGRVTRPGVFPFDYDISLAQSIAEAGGLKQGAKPEYTLVIRRQGTEKIVGIEVNLKSILNGEAVQNDFRLRNEDIVLVPQGRISSAAEFMEEWGKIVSPPVDLMLRGWQVLLLNEQLKELQHDDTNN